MRDQIYQIVKSWNEKGHDQEDHEDCEDREDHEDRLIKDHEKQRGWTPVVEILVAGGPVVSFSSLCYAVPLVNHGWNALH